MNETIGIVRKGQIVLPPETHLPEGTPVRIEWEGPPADDLPPLEREPWTDEEVQKEIEQAKDPRWAF